MDMLQINSRIQIPESELKERFIRASGPGGQNVNKVATAVQLRFNAANSPQLSPAVKERLRRIAGGRMTADGELVIEAKSYRSQEKNRTDARERLAALIRRALRKPRKRKKTKPSFAAKQRRMDAKKKQAAKKKYRRKPGAGGE
jgi:ribosome-associated protein